MSTNAKGAKSNEGNLLQISLVLIIKILLSLSIGSLGSDLFVILLKSCKILTSLTELSFFHTLSDVPMHKGTLGIHKIELMINAAGLMTLREKKRGVSLFESQDNAGMKSTDKDTKMWTYERASAMAVVLATIQTARWTRAKSPPGTTVGGW